MVPPATGSNAREIFGKNSLQFSFFALKQMMILKSRKMFVLCKIYFHAQSEDSSQGVQGKARRKFVANLYFLNSTQNTEMQIF